MRCLKAVAEENQVYPTDKFMKLVLSGEIKVSGLKFPKFNGSQGILPASFQAGQEATLVDDNPSDA